MIDLALFRWINSGWACAPLDALMPSFHTAWPWGLLLALLLILSLWRGVPFTRRETLVCLALILLTNLIASDVIKPLVGRERPCHTLEQVRLLTPEGNCSSSRSFPSAHAANLFAAAVFLSWRRRRRAWLLFPLAALIALSRVYIGVHWPSDVAAGALLGVALGTCAALIHQSRIEPDAPPDLPAEVRVGRLVD
ncbi:MAG: phosphatase PAP2 family protein [Candidatus Alcyoniella australis]|nr:phosphatase PAP2 family protein [Candidatus Alcyoniella australis]